MKGGAIAAIVICSAVVAVVAVVGGLIGGFFIGRKRYKCFPVACQWEGWSPWSDCSRECGTQGMQYRYRKIYNESTCGGATCTGPSYEDKRCNDFCYNGYKSLDSCECPKGFSGECCKLPVNDCRLTSWSGWSICSHDCGPLGTRFRNRTITHYPENGGDECESFTEQDQCNRICYNGGSLLSKVCRCPSGIRGTCCECKIKHCEMTDWSDWSPCSQECGPLGTRFRTRDIQQSPECGGSECPSDFSQQQSCNRVCYNKGTLDLSKDVCRCPDGFSGQCCGVKLQDCAMVPWSQWSSCSHTCGTLGKRFRTRDIDRSAVCGETMLPSMLSEEQSCNRVCYNGGRVADDQCNCTTGYTGECCNCKVKNCLLSSWSDWSVCSETCGPLGTQFRIRDVNQPAECGGLCSFALSENQPCNRVCRNGGLLDRTNCRCSSRYSGKCCDCEIKHCEMTDWSEWSQCSQECGPLGTRFRTRDIQQSPECGGSECPSVFSQQQSCNRVCYNKGTLARSEDVCRCPDGFSGQCCGVKLQDCAMIPWSQWSSCSHTCGALGKRFRTRDIDRSSVCGETMLPSMLSEEQSCNRVCYNGGTPNDTKQRCDCKDGYSGACCDCKIQDCIISGWSKWSACSKNCGPLGKQFRTRSIIKDSDCGGAVCPIDLVEQKECNQYCYNNGVLKPHENACDCEDGYSGVCCGCKDVDCSFQEWSDWSSCKNATRQLRSRDFATYASCSGRTCEGPLTEEKSCQETLKSQKLVQKAGFGSLISYALLVTVLLGIAVSLIYIYRRKKRRSALQNSRPSVQNYSRPRRQDYTDNTATVTEETRFVSNPTISG